MYLCDFAFLSVCVASSYALAVIIIIIIRGLTGACTVVLLCRLSVCCVACCLLCRLWVHALAVFNIYNVRGFP